MSPLAPLRTKLRRLVRQRRRIRNLSALATILTGLLVALAVYFVVDLVFRMDALQRLVVTTVAMLGVAWCWLRFSQPLIGVRENVIEMALAIQRRTGIQGDLVGGLQFEAASSDDPSSAALRQAVVRRAAEQTKLLDLAPEIDRRSMARRLSATALVAALWLAAAWQFPGYVDAFVRRLMLSPQPYPTRTRVTSIVVNGRIVPSPRTRGSRDVACAESRDVAFAVRVEAEQPGSGQIRISATPGARGRPLTLERLDDNERLSRISEIIQRLTTAIDEPDRVSPDVLGDALRSFLVCEAPAIARRLDRPADPATFDGTRRELTQLLNRGSAALENSSIFMAEMGQLTSPLEVQVVMGDAWVEPFRIDMIALPIAELHMSARPPPYAQSNDATTTTDTRQDLTVLEGSSVGVEVHSTGKQLNQCWVDVVSVDEPRRFQLERLDESGLHWRLAGAPALERVVHETRVIATAIDADGLSLAQPLEGRIRVERDHEPLAVARTVHQVVLPEAAPVIEYQADDDFGIDKIALIVAVERHRNDANAEPSSEPPQELVIQASPPGRQALPIAGRFPVPLAPFRLDKGDRLKLSLHVVDVRGEQPGVTVVAESIFLLVSDEAGVLEAVTAADETSDKQLDEIINRQLGTGKSP